MGFCVHACKTYKVEYGTAQLNHQYDAFMSMLRDCCPDFWSNDDYGNGDDIEIDKEDFLAMIEKVKTATDETIYEDWGYDRDYYSRDSIVAQIQLLYDEADADNDFVRLCWW